MIQNMQKEMIQTILKEGECMMLNQDDVTVYMKRYDNKRYIATIEIEDDVLTFRPLPWSSLLQQMRQRIFNFFTHPILQQYGLFKKHLEEAGIDVENDLFYDFLKKEGHVACNMILRLGGRAFETVTSEPMPSKALARMHALRMFCEIY